MLYFLATFRKPTTNIGFIVNKQQYDFIFDNFKIKNNYFLLSRFNDFSNSGATSKFTRQFVCRF